jgi:tRNA/rRNA methyltransferase
VNDKTDSNKAPKAVKEPQINKPWVPPVGHAASGVGPNGPLSKAQQAALPGWGKAPAICLVQPQMGENIGATARAMANFGFSELILVAPRDVWPNPKAWALASGAEWPLENARVVDTTAEAITEKTLVIATTGTPRQLDKPLIGPREAVARIRAAMANGEQPVILFGSERAGLDNELIINADILVTYPVDGRFPSLNLAQSVACFCYEWASFSEAAGPPPGWTMEEKPAAPRGAFESFFDNLIAELDDSRFFWPDDRKTTMVETLRNALVRGRFTMGEISLIRGAVRSLVEGPRRRAMESDAARARELAQAWLAQQPDWDNGVSIECLYAAGTIIALAQHKNERTNVHIMTLKDWQIDSVAHYFGEGANA